MNFKLLNYFLFGIFESLLLRIAQRPDSLLFPWVFDFCLVQLSCKIFHFICAIKIVDFLFLELNLWLILTLYLHKVSDASEIKILIRFEGF